MKKWLKIAGIVSIVAILGVAASSAIAFAQGPGGDPALGPGGAGFAGPIGQGFRALGNASDSLHGGPRRGRGVGGEVTAIGEGNLTILTRNDETVVVNTSDETKVMLAETQSEGSLSDVEVGDTIDVRGRENDDGSVDARGIVVLPDGDRAGGRVTGVDGQTISVENREGSATIITNANTQFRLGREAGSLADVTEGKFVGAFGEAQDDGSLVARLVVVSEPREHGPRQGLRGGEVTAIDGTTFTLNTRRGDELTVLTDDTTQYRTCDDQEVSFGDIEVGTKIVVKGAPVEGQENTVQAEVIGIKQ